MIIPELNIKGELCGLTKRTCSGEILGAGTLPKVLFVFSRTRVLLTKSKLSSDEFLVEYENKKGVFRAENGIQIEYSVKRPLFGSSSTIFDYNSNRGRITRRNIVSTKSDEQKQLVWHYVIINKEKYPYGFYINTFDPVRVYGRETSVLENEKVNDIFQVDIFPLVLWSSLLSSII